MKEVGPADLAVVQKAQPQLKVLKEYGPKVQKAAKNGPGSGAPGGGSAWAAKSFSCPSCS
ncbi:hypothetical protein N7U49_43725 [Streptomyces sp. AD2-2]|nr:hypothetical protein N7U49_43725 [Streptomyces sp. AD2-2]